MANCCGWQEAKPNSEGIPQLKLVERKGVIAHVKYALLRSLCLSFDLLGTLIVLFWAIAWGKKGNRIGWDNDVVWATLDDNSWPARTWYKNWGATTFGHAVVFGHGDQVSRADLWAHEVGGHVEAYEAMAVSAWLMLGAFFLTKALFTPATALAVYVAFVLTLQGLIGFLGAMVTAWLRGEANAYRGSYLEEAARANVDTNFQA
jgi:hypothetical protein